MVSGKKFRKIWFFFLLLGIILLIKYLILISDDNASCGDGTFYNECSLNKPYYCFEGKLVENSEVCGCPKGFAIEKNSCVSDYQTNPKKISLRYVLDGTEKEIDFIAYDGVKKHASEIPRIIGYENGESLSRSDFKMKAINDNLSREFILPLVKDIQNITNDKDVQAMIAVSLVQNLEWGFSNETYSFFGQKVNHSRYPYEVLYEEKGICGEKSLLLAMILKELGFGTAIFYNNDENHETVGIKCPLMESWHYSGYCFVETSGSAIITDDKLAYSGGIILDSKPEVIVISDGISLSRWLDFYHDADEIKELRKKMASGKELNPFEEKKFKEIKNKYGLDGEYNLD
ncbi:MAG TPA: hypothetical protein VJZ93_00210 [Candidatus Nanoarchaeia archaeon]|nr:hypothetical protein [Candidatus Nanoarchaeia archaeon]